MCYRGKRLKQINRENALDFGYDDIQDNHDLNDEYYDKVDEQYDYPEFKRYHVFNKNNDQNQDNKYLEITDGQTDCNDKDGEYLEMTNRGDTKSGSNSYVNLKAK